MNAAVVVAAGRGERMGLGRNKAFAPLCGVPVVVRAVHALQSTGLFGAVVVVTGRDDLCEMRKLFGGEDVALCEGGADRQESVRRGLAACPPEAEIIAIHDAARPLVPAEVVRAAVESAQRCGSGVAAVPLKDTVKRVDAQNRAVETPDRSALRAVQTPQAFRASLIRRAHETYKDCERRATDDAALVERLGERVTLTEGSPENIKLTTPEDLPLAERLLLRREGKKTGGNAMRIGHGYDVHRLVEGRRLVLCGVEVPHSLGLLGHSDADVALHALMDALLGAAALGDIGRHFPDTDPQYAGADSTKLLDRVMELLEEKGYRVENADVTIVCQRPKLKDYIEDMRRTTAKHLHTDIENVNVKATTTEKLGFEGEGLGISAHAVACISRA